MHSALHIAGNLTVFLAVVFWLGLAYWMYRDASRRLTDPWLVGSAGLLGVAVPYLGALIYLLVRPPETLAEAHARDLEVQALSQRLNRRDEHCPVCHARRSRNTSSAPCARRNFVRRVAAARRRSIRFGKSARIA